MLPLDEHRTNGPGSFYTHRELPGGLFPQAKMVTCTLDLGGDLPEMQRNKKKLEL